MKSEIVDLKKWIVLNQNMLRYAEMELKKEAYLDCVFVLDQIRKSVQNLLNCCKHDFRLYIIRAKTIRKRDEALKMASTATLRLIDYGERPVPLSE